MKEHVRVYSLGRYAVAALIRNEDRMVLGVLWDEASRDRAMKRAWALWGKDIPVIICP